MASVKNLSSFWITSKNGVLSRTTELPVGPEPINKYQINEGEIMKQRVRFTLLFVWILALFIVGCSKELQDKPLPMSQENLERFASELEKAAKSITPSPSQDGAELLVSAYKMVLEKKMGYSFDKTIRSVMLFYHVGAPWELMNPVIGYVHNDPKKALDKGFISQRTFDILDTGSKAKTELTKEDEEFLSFVAECQSKNNGICDPKLLLNVLAANNALPAIESSPDQSESFKLLMIESKLEGKYDIFHMGINKWITKPDGQDINTNGLLSQSNPAYKFVINKTQIDISKRYSNIIAEEKTALSL